MPAEPPDPQAKPSSWSRLPASEPDTSPAAPGDRDAVRVIAARAGAAVRDQASQAAKRVGESIRRASSAFASQTGAELEGLLAGVDLPEIGGEGDAVAALALRLDREADFWRGLALRSLARAAWADRVAQIVAVLSGIGGVARAGLPGRGGRFGGARGGGRAGRRL